MEFKNLSDTTNKNFMHAFGITTNATGLYSINNADINFSIAPNPVTSELTVIHSIKADFDLQIFNALGKKIIQSKNSNTIDVSTLDNGIYFVKINSIVRKFVKE